jgi:integrase
MEELPMPQDPLPPGISLHYGKFRARKANAGKRISRTFDTLEEAESFLGMLTADVEDTKAVEAARVRGAATIMEVVRLWWLGPLIDGVHRGGHQQRVSALTKRQYQYYIDAYVSRVSDESAQAYARNTGLLKLFYDSLPNRCAWHVHGVLRMAFRDAVTRGLMDRNPCEIEKPAKRRRRKRMVPTRAEVERIVAAAENQDPQWGSFVYLTSTLGTRCGETVALRGEDFDEMRRVVYIERAVTKTAGGPTIKEPKSGESRELPVDDADFWEHLRPVLDGPGFLFRGFHRNGPRVRAANKEKPWHPDHAQKRFKTMVKGLGLPPYTLHSLRHFVATQLLVERQPINQVAEFLGHSPQMTLTLYGRHLDREAMQRVGRAATGLVPRPDRSSEAPSEATEAHPPSRARAPAAPVDQAAADEAVLELARAGPLTNAQVQRETGLTRRQAYKALDRLARGGQLTRHGSRRGTHYSVPDPRSTN